MFSKLFNRIKKKRPGGFLAGKMRGGMLPRFKKRMGMMGGLAGLRDRMRNPRMPLMGGMRDISPLSRQPLRRMLPIMDIDKLPPQPGGNRKFLDMLGGGASSDIMPRDPGFGVNLPKPKPIMPGVMPRPVPEPVVGTILGMKEGGEFPNAGLAALAKERPDVVKKILGKQAGGEISLFEIYSRLQKSMGSLSKDEMDLLKDMYSDGRFSAGDMMQKVKDFRAGKFMPRKFEDNETKRNRLSRTMGTGESARGKMPSRLGNLVKGGLGTLARLPKFSVPSALAGFGAGYLLDNMFEGEPEEDEMEMETITLTQEELDALMEE